MNACIKRRAMLIAIESTAKGTVWVLERASVGARMTVIKAEEATAKSQGEQIE